MNKTSKILGAGAAIAALSLAGAYAFADQGHGHGHGRMGMGMGHGMGQGMMNGGGRGGQMGQFGNTAERLASAKSAIGIKAEQTAAWDAYAKVVTDIAAERKDHREKMDHGAHHDMKSEDHAAFRDAMIKQRDEAQAKVKVAADALLSQLDDAQKMKAQQTLPGLSSAIPGHGGGMSMGYGMMGGHSMGEGRGMGHGRGEGMGSRSQR